MNLTWAYAPMRPTFVIRCQLPEVNAEGVVTKLLEDPKGNYVAGIVQIYDDASYKNGALYLTRLPVVNLGATFFAPKLEIAVTTIPWRHKKTTTKNLDIFIKSACELSAKIDETEESNIKTVCGFTNKRRKTGNDKIENFIARVLNFKLPAQPNAADAAETIKLANFTVNSDLITIVNHIDKPINLDNIKEAYTATNQDEQNTVENAWSAVINEYNASVSDDLADARTLLIRYVLLNTSTMKQDILKVLNEKNKQKTD
jgi:hypothetical protein